MLLGQKTKPTKTYAAGFSIISNDKVDLLNKKFEAWDLDPIIW